MTPVQVQCSRHEGAWISVTPHHMRGVVEAGDGALELGEDTEPIVELYIGHSLLNWAELTPLEARKIGTALIEAVEWLS